MAAPRPRSVLAYTPCETACVELHGECNTVPGHFVLTDTVVAIESEADATGAPRYSVSFSGGAVDEAELVTAGGACLYFTSPDALRVAAELFARAVLAAERHGVLPPADVPQGAA